MQLRQYQEDGLQALWQYFLHHKGNPVLAWPTGTGKSLVPAEFIRRTLINYPNERFIVATHVKELIQQNYNKQIELWPNAPVGIYSAGLKRKDIFQQIIYGGIQSMYRYPEYFGHRDVLFIDEAHLVSQDDASMYLGFIAALRKTNPYLRVIGLSATPYRMGQGMITDGGLFTDIAHNLTKLEDFNKLISDGYLAPLVPKRTTTEIDVSNVRIQAGEFVQSQLQSAVDKAEITWSGLQELVYHGQRRRSWLIFATGIEHAEHIREMLAKLNVECAAVHSKQSVEHNDAAIRAFKSYELKAIVNFGKLTTGFDHPGIDLIGMFRPTLSVALWVQMLGRGTRPAQYKENCLVLDFARNTPRLGPINDPVLPRKKGGKGGEIPIKICEACGVYNHIKAVKCDPCQHPFEFKVKIVERAGTDALLRDIELPIIESKEVGYVTYVPKQGKKGPYLLTTYFCGSEAFKEFVFPENPKGFAIKKFNDWWRMRNAEVAPPKTVSECAFYTAQLRAPKKIRVHVNRMVDGKNYPEVLGVEF